MMRILLIIAGFCMVMACGKKQPSPGTVPEYMNVQRARFDNTVAGTTTVHLVKLSPEIRVNFSRPVNRSSVAAAVRINEVGNSTTVSYNLSYESNDSVVRIVPSTPLKHVTAYTLNIATTIRSADNAVLGNAFSLRFYTQIDSTDKFPLISDNALMDTIQRRTFRYFWDFGHPVSGLARERNSSNETVTSGGSGFGIMAIPVAIHRNFITRAEGLARMQKIVGFLKNTAQKFKGAFPHWLNGTTGAVIPFSTKDNGADLVETSYLIAGLLTARQYFNGGDAAETALRADINQIADGVQWSWFRQNNQQVLYWHWSPNYNFEMNLKVQGWNECLITYIMAASANVDSIPASVYHAGFARNGAMANNGAFYGINLPLGSAYGGPLFFAHYSFLGVNPNGLTDSYANYLAQVTNHTRINYEHCKLNPAGQIGYSSVNWGLTASDVPNGYAASSPTNDLGVIAPTAALSSIPYTPTESMNALRFFYYKLGDKLFKEYGFVDAFSLKELWFANSTLAIDQGPIIVMMENYRSQLIWNLFTSCPEVKRGMKRLGFNAPYL